MFGKTVLFGFLSLALAFVVAMGPSSISAITPQGLDSKCFFGDTEESVCPMAALHHISHWQGALTGTPTMVNLLVLALPVVVAFALLLFGVKDSTVFARRRISSPTLYQILFAQGLLNSKAY